MSNKQILKITKVPLRNIWPKEDSDFTVWLEKNIDSLNEVIEFDISIESREEKVGPFKVDLFGEDSSGAKVIIENQLEKTDHSHLGQLITYLTNLDAKTAIWIAKYPTEEHAAAIDWLNEVTPDDISFYLIKVEAIKIGDNSPVAPLFTVIKKPTIIKKQIGSEKKQYAHRHIVRENFWTTFLDEINKKNSLYKNVSPSKDAWIGLGIGKAGVNLNTLISNKYTRVEIYINRGDQEENKRVFDYLYSKKRKIEKIFGGKMIWERMDDNVSSRIKYQLNDVNVFNENDWPKMIKFLVDASTRMRNAFKESVSKINSLKN